MPDPFGLERIATELAGFERERLRMFATSSFQTNSVVLLHLISRFAPRVPVYFLNTGFHFPETLDFQRSLSRLLSLDVRALFSPVARSQQRDMDGRLLFASDPDRCCYLNKVLPLDAVIAQHDLWISGIRSEQSNARAALGRHATGRLGVRRYHPILDWDGQMVHGCQGIPWKSKATCPSAAALALNAPAGTRIAGDAGRA